MCNATQSHLESVNCTGWVTWYCFIVLDDIISSTISRTFSETGKRILTIRGFFNSCRRISRGLRYAYRGSCFIAKKRYKRSSDPFSFSLLSKICDYVDLLEKETTVAKEYDFREIHSLKFWTVEKYCWELCDISKKAKSYFIFSLVTARNTVSYLFNAQPFARLNQRSTNTFHSQFFQLTYSIELCSFNMVIAKGNFKNWTHSLLLSLLLSRSYNFMKFEEIRGFIAY